MSFKAMVIHLRDCGLENSRYLSIAHPILSSKVCCTLIGDKLSVLELKIKRVLRCYFYLGSRETPVKREQQQTETRAPFDLKAASQPLSL